VIKVMVSKTPGDTLDKRRSNAQDKIKQLREQVVDRSDEDFAKVASQTNDDPVLMKNGGRATEDGWMKKGEYRVTKVEEEVWKLQPGQVTEVFADRDDYYIARLSDRKFGHTRSFDDAEVQLLIADALRRPRADAIQQQELKKLKDDAVVFPATPRYEVVFNMVMQKYPVWAAGK
jgi:parvulin-like peptidyl-prolyl isomerase